jgi:uncharacterized protein (TIGR03437 family)
MQQNPLKLFFASFFFVLAIFYGLTDNRARASSSGPPASHTNAPGELNCAISGCHTSQVNGGPGTLTLSGLPEIGYVPNERYDVTIRLSQNSRSRFGFQLTVLDDQGRMAGDFDVLEPLRTEVVSARVGANQRKYLGHILDGTTPNGVNQCSWVVRWIAPAQNVGRVTFYVVGNAANGNREPTGDFIYTLSRSVQFYVAPQTVTTVSAASFQPGAASEAIVTLFAAGGLAGSTSVASSVPLPTELGGVQVRVKDSLGVEREAPLFFVSPGQINWLMPQGVRNGTANITVLRDNNSVGAGTALVDTVAPALFTANASGQGAPAAVLLRLKTDGAQSIEPVAQFNATTNRFESVPIDLGPEGEQVFLIAFGTGYRSSALANVSSTIGGAPAEVLFAGATPGLEGLDQANIRIPRSLAGRGTVDVVFRAEGKTANTVQIAIK